MHHKLLIAGLVILVVEPAFAWGSEEAPVTSKQALQLFNDYIGTWNGSGGPDGPRPAPRETWKESLNWRWQFKGDDVRLIAKFQDSRHWKIGELRYLPEKKAYQLTARTTDNRKLVFEGGVKDEILTLERVDGDTKETQRLKMNLAGDGARFVYRFERKPAGRTLFFRDYQVAFTKEGESLVATQKKIECVVSGGLGTMAVNLKGTTYYVCCTGCRDAFLENPEKYIREFKAKKGGKK